MVLLVFVRPAGARLLPVRLDYGHQDWRRQESSRNAAHARPMSATFRPFGYQLS